MLIFIINDDNKTLNKEGTRVTCDIFIVFDYVYVYKKHAKNSIFIWFGTYSIYIVRVAFSAFSGHALFLSIFFDFCNRYIQINAAEYRRL